MGKGYFGDKVAFPLFSFVPFSCCYIPTQGNVTGWGWSTASDFTPAFRTGVVGNTDWVKELISAENSFFLQNMLSTL